MVAPRESLLSKNFAYPRLDRGTGFEEAAVILVVAQEIRLKIKPIGSVLKEMGTLVAEDLLDTAQDKV